MSHFSEDVHRRVTTRVREIIPDFVESEYPQLVAFILAYYEFLEQYDSLPIASTFNAGSGLVTIQTNNSTVVGANTTFSTTFAINQRFKVGADIFTVKTIGNNTSLTISDIPAKTYFANTYYPETQKTVRQSKGALRQILTFHDIDETLDDFIIYFRNTFLNDIPQGMSSTSTLTKRIIDFYQSRGSEESYKFLFRALYNKEIDFFYPRDSVFTTSENQYEAPSVIKLNIDTAVGDVTQLVTREIVGLTSNAQATVSFVTVGNEADIPTAIVTVENIQSNKILSNILIESDDPTVDGSCLTVTAYGTPPEGLSTTIYPFHLTTEEAGGGVFLAGETISTVPVEDPLAITAELLGSVSGFTISETGQNYNIGDKIYVPYGFSDGYGAVGQVASLISTDILSINVVSGGDGYYANLSLIVDNSGTGGYGLSGYVSKISSGDILTESSERIIFTALNETSDLTDFVATREAVTYYEQGVSIADVLVGDLLLNSDSATEDGYKLLFEDGTTTYNARRNDQEVILNASDWSGGNALSSVYNLNLSSLIGSITSTVNYLPWYVNGSLVEIGKISEVTLISTGADYTIKSPYVYVPMPTSTPTADIAGSNVLSTLYYTFEMANLVPVLATGQIGKIDVISSGGGYVSNNNTFFVNSTTSTTVSGNGAEVGIVVAGIIKGQGRFKNTKSMASGDMYLQSEDKYQPFSYILSSEENLSTYQDIVKRLVHPAGGLLLARRIIDNAADLSINSSSTISTTVV